MRTIIKFATPAVFAFAALSVNAQTIETDYPQAVPAGPVAATLAPSNAVTGVTTYSGDAPYLIQSNAEGPHVDPNYARANPSTLTRNEVQSQAAVHVQWNAPDRRS